MPDAQQGDDLLEGGFGRVVGGAAQKGGGLRCARQAEAQIAHHIQVIKQAGLLEDIAQRAAVRGHPDASLVVLPDVRTQAHQRPMGALQTRHGPQDAGLA